MNQLANQVDGEKIHSDAVQLQVVDATIKIEKLQATMKDYIELIEAMDEKLVLSNEAQKDTRVNLHKKLAQIEQQILAKLDGGLTD